MAYLVLELVDDVFIGTRQEDGIFLQLATVPLIEWAWHHVSTDPVHDNMAAAEGECACDVTVRLEEVSETAISSVVEVCEDPIASAALTATQATTSTVPARVARH